MQTATYGPLGWPTALLLAHDSGAAGLLRLALSAAPARRQAIFAAIALEHARVIESEVLGRKQAGELTQSVFLRDGRARDIIETAYGICPEGFLGALERIGSKPLKTARAYIDLHNLFADPEQMHRASALRHVGSITEGTIQIVMALRAPFTTHAIVSRLRHVGDAHAFMRAVDIVQKINTQATDAAILDAAAALRPDTRLPTLIDRLVRRANVLPPPPLPADDEVTPFTSAAQVIATGHRYRNCLRTKLKELLSGQRGYVEFREQVIMEFSRLSNGGWLYVDCHGPRNGIVPDEVEQAARLKAASRGIPHLIQPNPWQGFGACGALVPDLTNPLVDAA